MENDYNYKLFPSKEDQDKFQKIQAIQFLERSENQRQGLLEELEKLIENCGKVLSSNEIIENLVKQIIEKNGEINNNTASRSEEEIEKLKEERSAIYERLLNVIRSLKEKHTTLVVGEDLERDANRAFDRQEKIISIERKEQEVKEIISDETISHEEILSAYPFKQIRNLKGLNGKEKTEEIENNEKEEEIVTGITEAPEILLDKTPTVLEEPTKEEIAETPVLTDNSFFATDDELKEAIEQTPDIQVDEAKETPVSTMDDPVEVQSDGLALLDEIVKEKEEISSTETKDITIPDNEKTLPELNDDNSLTYELTGGVSLSDVAESAYYDKETWNKLYELNKEIIDQKLNGTPIEFAKDDKNVLSGLIIRVPFTLDITNQKQEEVKKVA